MICASGTTPRDGRGGMNRMARAVALATAAMAGGTHAQQSSILDRAINVPSISYKFYGTGYSAKVVKDGEVTGGQAYRVKVASSSARAWDVGASAAVTKPIHKGDLIVVAIWLRAPEIGGDTTVHIPFFGLIGPARDYGQVAEGKADVGGEWKLYNVRGVARDDYSPGQASIAIHLGASKAVLDLGPVFVLDMGRKVA